MVAQARAERGNDAEVDGIGIRSQDSECGSSDGQS